jgi:hypothetical protein
MFNQLVSVINLSSPAVQPALSVRSTTTAASPGTHFRHWSSNPVAEELTTEPKFNLLVICYNRASVALSTPAVLERNCLKLKSVMEAYPSVSICPHAKVTHTAQQQQQH